MLETCLLVVWSRLVFFGWIPDIHLGLSLTHGTVFWNLSFTHTNIFLETIYHLHLHFLGVYHSHTLTFPLGLSLTYTKVTNGSIFHIPQRLFGVYFPHTTKFSWGLSHIPTIPWGLSLIYTNASLEIICDIHQYLIEIYLSHILIVDINDKIQFFFWKSVFDSDTCDLTFFYMSLMDDMMI